MQIRSLRVIPKLVLPACFYYHSERTNGNSALGNVNKKFKSHPEVSSSCLFLLPF